MREVNLQSGQCRKYQVTTNSSHKQPVFDHRLQREFDVMLLGRAYAADMTYICRREGYLLSGASNLVYINPNDFEQRLLEMKQAA